MFAKVVTEVVIITPVSKTIGFIVTKFPVTKNVYTGIKRTKIIIASIGAFISVRLIARFDYWALILSDSLPQIPIETKSILSGLRRLRIGQKDLSICLPRSNEILNLVTDEDTPVKKKRKSID